MATEYVTCPNGHFYDKSQGQCPYCLDKTQISTPDSPKENAPTEILNIPQSNRPITDPLKTLIPGVTDTENLSPRQSQRKLVAWIVSYKMNPYGTDFRIYEGRNTIGRGKENDITLFDETVSQKHAVILFRNNRFFLADEMSANGTYLNGEEVFPDEKKRLRDGDVITFGKGKAEFIFKIALPLEK